MNWLMYVAGGYVFVAVFQTLTNTILRDGDTRQRQHIRYGMLILIWVWICWRFVSFGEFSIGSYLAYF